MKEKIQDDIVNTFAEYLTEYQVNINSKFNDLNMDNLDYVDILTTLENKLDIEIDDEYANKFESIKDVSDYIVSICLDVLVPDNIKIGLTETLESKSSFVSVDKIIELIKIYFVNKENIEIQNIAVTMHKYKDDYDFYIEVDKRFVSKDESLEYVESYRFKQNDVLELLNNYLEQFSIAIDKTSNGDCLWLKYELAYEFHFRFVNIN